MITQFNHNLVDLYLVPLLKKVLVDLGQGKYKSLLDRQAPWVKEETVNGQTKPSIARESEVRPFLNAYFLGKENDQSIRPFIGGDNKLFFIKYLQEALVVQAADAQGIRRLLVPEVSENDKEAPKFPPSAARLTYLMAYGIADNFQRKEIARIIAPQKAEEKARLQKLLDAGKLVLVKKAGATEFNEVREIATIKAEEKVIPFITPPSSEGTAIIYYGFFNSAGSAGSISPAASIGSTVPDSSAGDNVPGNVFADVEVQPVEMQPGANTTDLSNLSSLSEFYNFLQQQKIDADQRAAKLLEAGEILSSGDQGQITAKSGKKQGDQPEENGKDETKPDIKLDDLAQIPNSQIPGGINPLDGEFAQNAQALGLNPGEIAADPEQALSNLLRLQMAGLIKDKAAYSYIARYLRRLIANKRNRNLPLTKTRKAGEVVNLQSLANQLKSNPKFNPSVNQKTAKSKATGPVTVIQNEPAPITPTYKPKTAAPAQSWLNKHRVGVMAGLIGGLSLGALIGPPIFTVFLNIKK